MHGILAPLPSTTLPPCATVSARWINQIDANETIAGISMLDIRDLFKRAHIFDHLYLPFFWHRLHISEKRARVLVTELTQRGYLELTSKRPKQWKVTVKGRSLANAKAAKPIRRATAKRVLEELMERVHEVNTNSHYLYRVTRVVVFESYLSEQETIGDVDVAIDMTRKIDDVDEFERRAQSNIEEAEAHGRVFNSWYEEHKWAEREIWLFLKSRSRALSLHDWQSHQKLIVATTHKVLYAEAPDQAQSNAPARH